MEVAESLGTEILGADSRQLYRGIPIGTAVPTQEMRRRVPHRFVECLDLDEYYSAALYEEQALKALEEVWRGSEYAVMCGGSMMYIDAVTRGIDTMPTISEEVRARVHNLYAQGGLTALHDTLELLDPVSLERTDHANPRRLMHAIEITLQAGVPCSSLRKGEAKERPFRIIKMAPSWSRAELFDRINRRTDAMIEAGLEEEARRVLPLRHLNSLNAVGYREMFAMFDGTMDRETAIARIAKNTRVYAKKQMLWLSKDPGVHLLDPSGSMSEQALRIIKGAD